MALDNQPPAKLRPIEKLVFRGWALLGCPLIGLLLAAGMSDSRSHSLFVFLFILLPAILSFVSGSLLRIGYVQRLALSVTSGLLGVVAWLGVMTLLVHSGALD